MALAVTNLAMIVSAPRASNAARLSLVKVYRPRFSGHKLELLIDHLKPSNLARLALVESAA